MTYYFEISDILDFCYDAPDTPTQQELATAMLIDPYTLDTVRYIMSLKLELGDRDAVETYLEQSKKEALSRTMQQINSFTLQD